MGFFSSILTAAAPILGAVLGLPAAPVAAAVPAIIPPTVAQQATGLLAKGTQGPLTPEQIREFQAGRLSGRLRKRTTVETFDPVSGVVIRSTSFLGGVAVRAADVAALKRVVRQVSNLNKRIPKKRVKESDIKQLTDRVVKNALDRAGDCPPKPCP
jgi:hypothetical protein